ncbi:MAG: 3-hydroxyacyl-CoA dehydrogenase NAD-binding domain-containing protein [Longimonas sp.]|uniref:3-hydroxyacyl-CoA dehydrogenase/enoyl-CoA hydratase family protein n=1 Tax=Longimonas sp. TaxID=2039626 RepID=UPI003360F646
METTSVSTRSLQVATPTTHRPFRTAAVLGAGTMGAQIAAHLANAGLNVHLLDIAGDDDPNSVVKKSFKQTRKASPDPFVNDEAAERITLGNFDDHFERIAEADWVIEAVVERMDIKRSIHERVEQHAADDAVISTNTSGLPINEIAEGRSDAFKQRFLGTHFFNPPRYLELLELIPTADTAPDLVERVAQFGRVHLGKSIVVANDVPYFIGNRVGVYGQLQALRFFTDGDYTIEEIDTLTGPLVGRPKSATFRTADLVGLDVLLDVTQNLYDKVEDDEQREAFHAPDLLQKLVEAGKLGQKTRAGFYTKDDGEIKSVDPDTLEYTFAEEQDLGDLRAIKKAGDLTARLQALWNDDGRAGHFFRETTLDLLAYSANRIGEITENPADVDRAIRWGFGWEMGPFEMWDALGVQRVLDALSDQDRMVPDWVDALANRDDAAFYRTDDGAQQVYRPSDATYIDDAAPRDELTLASIKTDADRTLWQNDEAALLDIGDGVALFEFRSKANALGQQVMRGLHEVINRVEDNPNLRGLVIGNEGKNFSVGANLGEMAESAMQGDFQAIGAYIKQFQQTIQKVRYATKPVVVATHQKVLGGGCEMAMACPQPVASLETYIGLVELGVGLIPAGTGTMRMAAWADQRAASDHPSDIQAILRGYFETIAMAEVAESAHQAIGNGILPEHTTIVMHDKRRLHVAKQQVIAKSEQGYLPPPTLDRIKVLGEPGRAAFDVALHQYKEGGYISEYDQFLAHKLAYVMTGGDLSAPQEVDEQYLLDLEVDVFLSLLGEEKTQARVEHILKHNKPLRN